MSVATNEPAGAVLDEVSTALASPASAALEGAAADQGAHEEPQAAGDTSASVSLRPNAPPAVDEALAKEIVRQVWSALLPSSSVQGRR